MAGDWGISRRLRLIRSDCGESSITPEIGNICSFTSACVCVCVCAVMVAMMAELSPERGFEEEEVESSGWGDWWKEQWKGLRNSGEEERHRFKVSKDGRGADEDLTSGTLGRSRMCYWSLTCWLCCGHTDCQPSPDSPAQLFAIIAIIATFQLCSDPSFSWRRMSIAKAIIWCLISLRVGKSSLEQPKVVKVTFGNFKILLSFFVLIEKWEPFENVMEWWIMCGLKPNYSSKITVVRKSVWCCKLCSKILVYKSAVYHKNESFVFSWDFTNCLKNCFGVMKCCLWKIPKGEKRVLRYSPAIHYDLRVLLT